MLPKDLWCGLFELYTGLRRGHTGEFCDLYIGLSRGYTGELLWSLYWAEQGIYWRAFVIFILDWAEDKLASFCDLYIGLSRGYTGELLWSFYWAEQGIYWRAFVNFILGSAGDKLASFFELYSVLKREILASFCESYNDLKKGHTGEIVWTLSYSRRKIRLNEQLWLTAIYLWGYISLPWTKLLSLPARLITFVAMLSIKAFELLDIKIKSTQLYRIMSESHDSVFAEIINYLN